MIGCTYSFLTYCDCVIVCIHLIKIALYVCVCVFLLLMCPPEGLELVRWWDTCWLWSALERPSAPCDCAMDAGCTRRIWLHAGCMFLRLTYWGSPFLAFRCNQWASSSVVIIGIQRESLHEFEWCTSVGTRHAGISCATFAAAGQGMAL